MKRFVLVAAVAVVTGIAAGGALAGAAEQPHPYGPLLSGEGHGPMVRPTVPRAPSVSTDRGVKSGTVRTFRLTAMEFTQKIANFPISYAKVWGYNHSTPGPTLIAYQGERVRIVLVNDLPVPTTLHPHGLHQPNSQDGVSGVSQPTPVPPGGTHVYTFTPGHTGTFAYHSHTDGPVEELRGLDGAIVVLPARIHASEQAQADLVMTLQQFDPPGEGQLVNPFPGGTGDFPFSTINGKTGDAAGGTITIHKGDLVRIRIYNASNLSHSMHLHGHDMVLVAKNGHAVPRVRETTQNVAPGDFFTVEFRADNPGNWIFHCHVPHHTSNKMESGWHGASVGMTRIFHYAGYTPVPKKYFQFHGDTIHVQLHPLNNSGVSGNANLALQGSRLTATVVAHGVTPFKPHAQAIYRLPDGTKGTCPPPTAAVGRDVLGDAALTLGPPPMADAGATTMYEFRTFVIGPNLPPLTDRVIVVSGGMKDGNYDPTLPVACGEIGAGTLG